jgi:Fe2+ transport system protein FeoA
MSELTLKTLPLNTSAIIRANANQQLQDLGYLPGETVVVTHRNGVGTSIARVANNSFALNQHEAHEIAVKLIPAVKDPAVKSSTFNRNYE